MSAALATVRRWRESPLSFVTECLGATPDAWQARVLQALSTQERVSLRACKGPGKSTVLAWAVLWWLATRPHPKIVCTSITADNLRDGLWAEIAKWLGRSELLQRSFVWGAERIQNRRHPETWWAAARAWPKGGSASEQADTLAGIHADFVMFVLDEAGGIPDGVAAAAEAGLANVSPEHGREGRFLIAGNPTHLSGPLWRASHQDRHLWWSYAVTGDPDDPERSPRVSLEWARATIAQYGADSPFALVNVFGRFPPGQANTLISAGDVSAAQARVVNQAVLLQHPRILGVDVARYGDDSSEIIRRQGPGCWAPRTLRNASLMSLADEVAREAETWKPHAIFVDETGLGAGVVDRLLQIGVRVTGVNFAGAGADKCHNKRDVMWHRLGEWIRREGALPQDSELAADLAAPLYSFTPAGLLKLESKADLKKRLGRSPSRGDALALTFAAPVPLPGVGAHSVVGQSRVESPVARW